MSRLRGLVSRAKELAKERVPQEVLEATRKVAKSVIEHAPPTVASTLERLVDSDHDEAPKPTDDSSQSEILNAAEKARADEVLQRIRDKSGQGLKPEDRLVVVYATEAEREDVEQIKASFADVETVLRHMDLDKEPLQTRQQLAKLTGVMVPPYVYINGKYWGAQYEMETLRASGDLEHVVANRLDSIGDEARRIGNIRESFSDDITVENILERWRRGHILCVDDLDAWYEEERDGTPRFYYQGGPRAVDDMQDAAEEIVAAVDADEYEAKWLLDPAISIG